MSTVGWRIAAGAFPLRSKSKFDLRADDGESGAADDVPMKPIDTSPAPPAIVVQGLTKRYGELTAVDDLSFAVRRGAVTGFLGPNGAGKTTVLKVIVGVARPSAGRALINGTPIDSMASDAHELASTSCWRSSASSRQGAAVSGSTRRVCVSGSGLRRRCSATRTSWFWTSR